MVNENMKKEIIKISESQLYSIIENEIRNIISLNEDSYVKYHKYNSPYNDKEKGNGVTQPLKNDTSLYDIRARIPNILYALKNDRKDDAKKQLLRLYKLVDAMINQGY